MEEKNKRGCQGEGGGRPSPYMGREIEIAEQIAARLRTGEPLAAILRENNMPSHETVRQWRKLIPEVECTIADARDAGFDVIAADCLAIADDDSNDTIETKKGEIANIEWILRSKLRVETRLKLLAKWDPKRYGDAVANQTVNVGVAVNTISDEELSELRAHKRAAVEFRLAQARETKVLTNGSNGHSHGN